MNTLVVFCALFAVALAGPGWNKDNKGKRHHFELKCGDQKIELDEGIKKINSECDTKIFGENKFGGMKKGEKGENKDGKREKPTPEQMKEMKTKMTENFEKNIKPKLGCASVCKAKALNLVNADGKVNKENYAKFVEKYITNKDLSAKILAEAEKCLTAHPVLFKEDTCTKDNDLLLAAMKCVADSSKTVCGVKNDAEAQVESNEDN